MSEERMIRRDNLKLLLKERGWIKADLAREFQFSDTYASKLVEGKGSFGEKVARKIERLAGKPHGWLDTVHLGGTYETTHLADDAAPESNVVPLTAREPSPAHQGAPLDHVVPMSDGHGKKTQRAPVVAWAALEESVSKPNREWPTEALTPFIAIEAVKRPSEFTKISRVLESPFPHIEPGDHIAVDPVCKPWDGCMVVIKTSGGRVMLRRYRSLVPKGFEAICPGENPLDARHGITLVGVVVSLTKSHI